MAERAIVNQRKGQQFLSSIAPVSASFDELVQEKLECGKFPLTKTGWIKIAAMLVSLAGLALHLGQTPCEASEDTPDWYTYAYSGCVGANLGVQLIFYMIFSCGATVKAPGVWVKADIILNLIFAIVGIVGSALITMEQCTENPTMHRIPGPLGIAGGIVTVIGCAAIFLLYRYVEDETTSDKDLARNVDPRKSMHA